MKNFIPIFILLCFTLSSSVAQTAAITFKVDMSYQIQLGNFNAATDFTDIAGTFNNWGGDLTKLTDADNDKIYEVTVSGLSAGVGIEFKFRMNGAWDGTEEFPGGGANRMFTPQTGANEVFYWYNDETPAGTAPIANFSASEIQVLEESVVTFFNTTTGTFTEQEWIFEGGMPASSTDVRPKVRYANSGTYDVQLIVGDGAEYDTLYYANYIEVAERDEADLSWWNDAVFYEIFVRSFKDSDGDGIGDFQGIIEKLDYLNDGDPNTTDDLGVTGIWLMPINPSPSYHGYDVTDYQAINPDYGSMDDFKAFLEAAHQRGIKVIIDFVMNHSSTEHPWFQNARQGSSSAQRNWYRWNSINPNQSGPWGQQVWHWGGTGYFYGVFWSGMPDLNYGEPEVKTAMFDAADFWLQDIGIDGFRLDAVKFIHEEGNTLEDADATFLFWKEYQQQIKQIQPNALSVGEAWTSTEKVLDYVENDGLDICFEFDLSGSILDAVRNQNAASLTNQIQKVYNLYPHLQFASFLSNHDQNRIMDVLNNSQEQIKSAAAIYLTLPGVPFIYYGEEIGMKGSKPDENIRRPMQWSPDTHAGFSTSTPWHNLNSNYANFNVALQDANSNSLLSWYRQLINIRNENAVLRTGRYEPISTNQNKVLAYNRILNEDFVLVINNISNSTFNDLELDASFSSLLPGSYSATDLITGNSYEFEVTSQRKIRIPNLPFRTVRLLKANLSTSTTNLQSNSKQLKIYPNPAHDFIILDMVNLQADTLDYRIYNTAGQLLQSGAYRKGEQLNIQKLGKGIFLLEVQLEGKRLEGQFIIRQ